MHSNFVVLLAMALTCRCEEEPPPVYDLMRVSTSHHFCKLNSVVQHKKLHANNCTSNISLVSTTSHNYILQPKPSPPLNGQALSNLHLTRIRMWLWS
jgi:hypothetical protein